MENLNSSEEMQEIINVERLSSCSTNGLEEPVMKIKENCINKEMVIALFESSESESDSDEDMLDHLDDDELSEEEFIVKQMFHFNEFQTKKNSSIDYMTNVVPNYTETVFRQHFRVSKLLYKNLCNQLEVSDIYKNLRRDKRLPSDTHMAVFLWFAGHEGCCFRDLSDRFNLSLSSVHRIINRTTMFLSSLSPSVIVWPNEEKKLETAYYFKSKCGFSKIIGCIDRTHINIDPPKVCRDDYTDRKGNTSICLQGICNERNKFTNIFVGYPGSYDDSWILQNSTIYKKLQLYCGEYSLLGDSAYPCTNLLITPYKDNGHLSYARKNFNIKLNSGRVAIDHTFAILKSRFRQLHYCKLKGAKKLCHFIRACCVLHNFAVEDDMELYTEQPAEIGDDTDQFGESENGNAVRDPICEELERLLNQS